MKKLNMDEHTCLFCLNKKGRFLVDQSNRTAKFKSMRANLHASTKGLGTSLSSLGVFALHERASSALVQALLALADCCLGRGQNPVFELDILRESRRVVSTASALTLARRDSNTPRGGLAAGRPTKLGPAITVIIVVHLRMVDTDGNTARVGIQGKPVSFLVQLEAKGPNNSTRKGSLGDRVRGGDKHESPIEPTRSPERHGLDDPSGS